MNWQKILPSVPAGTPKTPSCMEALAQLRRLEVQEKRAELEHLRRYYGDSWLQAVEDQAVLPRPSSSTAVAHATDSASEGAAETSQSSRKPTGKEDNSMTVVVELHSGVAGKSELQSAAIRNSAEGAFHKDAMFLSSESGAEDGGASYVPAQASARLQPCGDDLHADDNSRRTEEMLLSGNSQLAAGKDHSKAKEKDGRVKKGEESPGLWDSLHDTMIEPGKYKSVHDTMIELGKYKSVHDTMIELGKYKSMQNPVTEPGKCKSVHDTTIDLGKYKSVHDTMIEPGKYKSVHDTTIQPGKYKSAHDTMIEPGKYKSVHDTMIDLGKYKSVHDTMVEPGKYKSVHDTMIDLGKYKSVHDTMIQPGKYKSAHDTMIQPGKYKSAHDTMIEPGKYKSVHDTMSHDWPG